MKLDSSSTRRSFIKRAALLGGAALLLAAGPPKTIRPEAAAPEPSASGDRGYRLTDHIKTYYEKARQS